MKTEKVTERTRPTRRPTVSREWVNTFASGAEVSCTRPWDTLKVNLFRDTKVCCSFFTKLPTFDWPSAKDFHTETGMWNHRFMQHMRQTMRTPDEIPYCTLCMDKDKRDPNNKELLDKATKTSLDIFREFQPRDSFSGNIDRLPSPLGKWPLTLTDDLTGETETCFPFKNEKDQYRDILKKFGFVGRDTVLLPGVSHEGSESDGMADYPIAPFLAEANKRLLTSGDGRDFAARLCRELGLRTDLVDARIGDALRLEDRAVDGIWLRGKSLLGLALQSVLQELHRVLRSGGTVHIRRAPCLGPLLDLAAQSNKRGDEAWARVSQGPVHEGRLNYFSRRSLDSMLKHHGFVVDNRYPLIVQARKATNDESSLTKLSATDLTACLSRTSFREDLRKVGAATFGVEQFVSFNARPR